MYDVTHIVFDPFQAELEKYESRYYAIYEHLTVICSFLILYSISHFQWLTFTRLRTLMLLVVVNLILIVHLFEIYKMYLQPQNDSTYSFFGSPLMISTMLCTTSDMFTIISIVNKFTNTKKRQIQRASFALRRSIFTEFEHDPSSKDNTSLSSKQKNNKKLQHSNTS